MTTQTLVPLALVPREIAALGFPAPSYRSLYHAVLDGRVPAVNERGRWYADPVAVAEAMGLRASTPTRAKRKALTAPAAA
jgi:hypothetical protein